MARIKRKKEKDIINDALTIFVNSAINKLMETMESKGQIYSVLIPFLVYYFGDTVFSKIGVINSEYITTNNLEKAIRNFTAGSQFDILKNNSKFIQSDELTEIEGLEDALLISGLQDEEYDEIEGDTAEIGDNIEYELVD